MIKLEISGVHMKLTAKERTYIEHKIGNLDHLLPAHAQKSVHGRVTLSRESSKHPEVKCEVVLSVPHKVLAADETARTLTEAVDGAADKIARLSRKYKTAHSKTVDQKSTRRFWRRVWPGN